MIDRLWKGAAWLLLAVAVVIGLALAFRSAVFTIRVALPPITPETQKAMGELSREIVGSGRWISFERIPVPDAAAAAQALAAGKADVALLRTDVAFPPEAQTLAIMRQDPIFMIVPAGSSIESFRDLKGQAVGMLHGPAEDDKLLTRLLTYFAVPPDSVKRVPITPGAAGAAVKAKSIAAVFVVGKAGVGVSLEAFASVAKATRGTPDIVAVDDAEALASRYPTLETAEIPQGAFGGAAPRPEETETTLATTWRLAARRDMQAMVAGELTERLFAARSRLLPGNPILADVQAPDTENVTIAIHPGAKSFLDGEKPSLFDRFESLFWIGSALIGILGSALTALIGRFRSGRKEQGDVPRLIEFLREVRDADRHRLEELHIELDDLVSRLLEQRQAGMIEDAELGTYNVGISYARQAIEERRMVLSGRRAA
jgi:TRAP-type uncharacterized transport system substrate-binding protein